jgi:hypothetical protein
MPLARPTLALAASLALAGTLAARPANSQANHQSYPLGERATGLGGAYAALADDAAGAWYNPGGLAFARDDSVSVSASLYGVVGARYPGSLGRGLDYDYATINVVPSSAASLLGFGDRRPDGTRPVAIAFNLYNPSTYQVERRVDHRDGATLLSVSSTDRLIVAGPTLAARASDRVGLGVGVLATLHTFYDRVDLSDLRSDGFVQFTSSLDSLSVGLALAAGARVEIGRHASIGISARTPSISVWGQGERFERTVQLREGAPAQVQTALLSVAPTRLWPAQLRVGVAWALRDRVALSVDASLSLGLRYDLLRTREGALVSAAMLRPVCNGAAGLEWYVRPWIALRGGVFTDVSAAPTPSAAGSKLDQVDQLGAALTSTFFVRGASTTLGAVGTWGTARVLGTDVASGTYDSFVTEGNQWRIYFIWAGTTRL